MASELKASPQNSALGALARALRGVHEFAARPFGYENPPVAALSELLGLPGAASLLEDMSYYGPGAALRGGPTLQTARLDPRALDLAGVAQLASPLARAGARGAGRLAAEGVQRAVERGSPLMAAVQPAYVVKPKGGNWLAGEVERAVSPLKRAEAPAAIPMDDAEMAAYRAQGYTRYDPETGELSRPDPLNQWIDQKLAKYIRNEMGTPEDPLRALIQERGVSHIPLEELQTQAGWIPHDVAQARKKAGFPELGMVEEQSGLLYGDLTDQQRAASGWETLTDRNIAMTRAGDIIAPDVADIYLSKDPWLAKVPPETPVYALDGLDAQFGHLVDELRNAVNPGSGLPRELQLRPEQLSKVTVPQAVERVAQINDWRAAQKAQADLARAQNAATVLHRDYPEAGFRWVELKRPEPDMRGLKSEYLPEVDMWRIMDESGVVSSGATEREAMGLLRRKEREQQLADALKYEGETMGHCVGGYCPDVLEGRSRIFSLRDAKGQPHVTVEVKPSRRDSAAESDWFTAQPEALQDEITQEAIAAHEAAKQARTPGEDRYYWGMALSDAIRKRMGEIHPEIIQIKGKANRAPKEEYLPYVQDFVKSGNWSNVGDLGNTGLVDISQYPRRVEALGGRYVTPQQLDDYLNQFGDAPPAGYARGGVVRNRLRKAGKPVPVYNPAEHDAIMKLIGSGPAGKKFASGGLAELNRKYSLTMQDLTPYTRERLAQNG